MQSEREEGPGWNLQKKPWRSSLGGRRETRSIEKRVYRRRGSDQWFQIMLRDLYEILKLSIELCNMEVIDY